MGYIDYMNTFNRWIEESRPSDKVIVLYYGLLNLFNQRRWPPRAAIDKGNLLTLARTTDKRVAYRARDVLAEAGFIEFTQGDRRGRATEYRLLEYGGKSLPPIPPVKSPPNFPPESPPPNKIKSKTKNNTSFSGGGERSAASEGERAVEDFATEHYDLLNVFLSTTEETKAEAEVIAEKLFLLYTNRQPTQADVARVYSHVRQLEDGVVLPFPGERVRLLAYAFRTANGAGKPGDWRYIEGVLAKMYQRGQTTSEEADDFDDLWADLRRDSGHG